MPRYHFEIVDGYKVEEPHGMELPSHGQAVKVAKEIARQLAYDLEDPAHTDVVVKDDKGEEVFKTKIKPE